MKKLLVAMLGLTILTGCTSEPAKPVQTEKPKPKTTEAVTGRTAFQKLYISARGWARDAQPYRLESQITADWKGKDGKSAIWRAYFASPNQRGVKPFIWSGSQAPDAPSPGITPGNEDTYNPTNSSTRVFDTAFAHRAGGNRCLVHSHRDRAAPNAAAATGRNVFTEPRPADGRPAPLGEPRVRILRGLSGQVPFQAAEPAAP